MDRKLLKEIRTSIKQGNTNRVIELINSDQTLIDVMTPFGSWLHVASAHGNLEVVRYLVDLGIDINIKGGILGGAAINEAASAGYLEVVKYLLQRGARVDLSEPQYNPLFSAIYGGHIKIVKLLISHGVNSQVKYSGENMHDMDALAFSYERGETEIADFLSRNALNNKE